MVLMANDNPNDKYDKKRKRSSKKTNEPKADEKPCNCVVVKKMRGVDFRQMTDKEIMMKFEISPSMLMMQSQCKIDNGYTCSKTECRCHADYGDDGSGQ